ncbi:hypothetical protein PPL_06851 [Heterostelium album PN500]|uniref:ER membrane protein complex subunit 2 n=1 Tax=Heterostelium pallidum (strain ATCC 26659 / Pp 5 / PN500) TaxID=670386 RepID=D3BDP9_HETP5|nr:hypothetical protein PPL_06851 [Heterostelium album PN500]EFA80030.1 hypothetical protein PPL_06851 [Heterostelium album PN500]|eukprot:XP_020432150.1 hypothetical protein PPL_06851 [Heterostelium album PN500]
MAETSYLLELSDYQNKNSKININSNEGMLTNYSFIHIIHILYTYFVLINNNNNNIYSVYDVVEQVILSLLDCSRKREAGELIDLLKLKFGKDSVRVQRLQAMLYECQNVYSRANEIYSNILEKYPADMLSMKRQIAILKSNGNYSQAITLLNTFLQIFMGDFEAWLELASLHIRLLSYRNAAFCYEELILIQPINHVLYSKYADIIYSIGGADNYIVALKYYTHSLELNISNEPNNSYPPTNLSSIYGIIMSMYAYCNSSGGSLAKLNEHQIELYNWAQNELKQITSKYSPTKLPLVTAFINSTNIKQQD